MEKMKALVFRDVGRMECDMIPMPQIQNPDDVIIRVAACGICGTDKKILEGKHSYKQNVVLGHEFAGTVVEVGTHPNHIKIGDRVCIDNNIRCGVCTFCRMGLSSQCTSIATSTLGVKVNGGMAEYCVIPAKQCYKLPTEIDDILATQVETLGTVVNGYNTLGMMPYDYVVIIGFGPIGYLFAAIAKNIAAKVAVTEIDPFRIGVAKELGVPVWNPNEVDVVKMAKEFTYGRGADIVIEATGSQLGVALQMAAPGGKVLPFGMDSDVEITVRPNDITRWATKVLGLYLGQNTMEPSIRMFQENRIEMKPFFTKVLPLEDGISAFRDLGLDPVTMEHGPMSAEKIVIKC